MGRLNGKVAVVTGGTGGIGQAITELFAREGAKVAVFDVEAAAADTLLDRVRTAGGQAAFHKVNITSAPEVERAVRAVADDFGPIDILVNAAAITGTARLTHEATAEDFDQVFTVNVKGTFLCTKFVVAQMLAAGRKGSVVNISSTYGVVGNADIPLYHATKAAVLMMAKTDGVTYAEQGIRFNAVLPGATRTPMALKAASISPEGAEYIKNLVADHPMKRQADPIEIANGVLFLASDEASFVTGTQLAIDGGYTAQ
jgi:NAD(P)-dependent dehydrogenase (short-subunit alcohol dehydrogenase family)